jgi:hypothetical protein
MSEEQTKPESYWDLLQDIARVQTRMGADLIAWAQAYEAAGRALERSGETVDLMADVGRRLELYIETRPQATVQQVLQLFTQPWQAMAAGAPGPAFDPFTRFWAQTAAALRAAEPPSSEQGE